VTEGLTALTSSCAHSCQLLNESVDGIASFVNTSIALMQEWEEKIDKMAHSTIKEDVTMIAGVPTWTIVLIKKIFEITGKTNLHEIWPNLELYMHGGVNFTPYEQQFNQMFYQNQENEQSVPNINPPLNIEQNHIDDSVNSHQNNNDEIDGMDSGSSYSSLSSSKDGSHASALDNPKILDDTYKNNNFSRRG
jgi:hypothetical protein